MNLINQIEDNHKSVNVKKILKGTATLIRIAKDGLLAKHKSQTDALLTLVSGRVSYEEEERIVDLVDVHDFVEIHADVTHKVVAQEDSILLLIQQ